MRLSKGVEWAAHACALIGALPEDWALSKDDLAEFLGVAPPYLAKQLQALSRAGLVRAQRGVSGGYRLARTPEAITLWDVTAAVEGQAPAFRCTEVRQSGPCPAKGDECAHPCEIAWAFWQAETAYREALKAVTLADLIMQTTQSASASRKADIKIWMDTKASRPA